MNLRFQNLESLSKSGYTPKNERNFGISLYVNVTYPSTVSPNISSFLLVSRRFFSAMCVL